MKIIVNKYSNYYRKIKKLIYKNKKNKQTMIKKNKIK
jgi:hypothetical protein